MFLPRRRRWASRRMKGAPGENGAVTSAVPQEPLLHHRDDWISVAASHREQKLREVEHCSWAVTAARLHKTQWEDSCCLLRCDTRLHVEELRVEKFLVKPPGNRQKSWVRKKSNRSDCLTWFHCQFQEFLALPVLPSVRPCPFSCREETNDLCGKEDWANSKSKNG